MSDGIEKPEISLELTSISGLQGKKRGVSSPRDAMFTGNTGQFVVIDGATRRRHKTMAEYVFGEATFKIAFPVDAEIIRVIHRFPKTFGEDSIAYNPRTIIIYKNHHTHEIDILDVVEYHTLHQHYGFEYKRNEAIWEQLNPGVEVPAGTVLSDSPNVLEDGDYTFGIEVPTILDSGPPGSEDGFQISTWLVDQIVPTGFGKRTIGFGSKQMPINLRGGNNKFQIFADIGEQISETGLVFAGRRFDELLSPVMLSPQALQTVDGLYDNRVYGERGATVVDVVVERNTAIAGSSLPVGMDEQLYKYYNADKLFYTTILDEYKALRYRQKNLVISEEFQTLVVEAIARVGKEYFRTNKQDDFGFAANKVNMAWCGMPLDEWMVTITYRYKARPNVGVKLTDTHGAKGVVCKVTPTEDMPIDENGNRCHLRGFDGANVNRLNPSRPYEQYFKAAERDLVQRMRLQLGFTRHKVDIDRLEDMADDPRNDSLFQKLHDDLLGYYDIVYPLMRPKIESAEYAEIRLHKYEHLLNVIVNGIYAVDPPDNPIDYPTALREVKNKYPAEITHVSWKGLDGTTKTSVAPVLIGDLLFMALEKTAEAWSAVASAKYQHFGTNARLTNFDKYSAPGRLQPTKFFGEAENRLIAATCGPDFLAHMVDMNSNPTVHREAKRNQLESPTPTNMDFCFDRKDFPIGGHRPVQFTKHIFQCSGKRFTNKPMRRDSNGRKLRD